MSLRPFQEEGTPFGPRPPPHRSHPQASCRALSERMRKTPIAFSRNQHFDAVSSVELRLIVLLYSLGPISCLPLLNVPVASIKASISYSTSLMRTLHYELCALIDISFFESKKSSVDTDVLACSQHQTSYVENARHGFDRWAICESFADLVRGMTALLRLEMFCLTKFMSSFISFDFLF